MPKKAPKCGDLVAVTFLDHAENHKDSIRFEVIGRLTDITRTAFVIKAWAYVDNPPPISGHEDNETIFAIVKRAVDEIRVLK